MRRLLDFLYDASAWLAALCMVGVLAMVLLSIVGRQLGFNVPGTDAYAGYFMAAAAFLALAHTLQRHEHIRVTLVLSRVGPGMRRALEIWSLSAAVVLAGLMAFFAVRLVWHSWQFNDVSTANDATPLWIPQLAMAAGAVVFCIAFVDEWVQELRGTRAQPDAGELLRNE